MSHQKLFGHTKETAVMTHQRKQMFGHIKETVLSLVNTLVSWTHSFPFPSPSHALGREGESVGGREGGKATHNSCFFYMFKQLFLLFTKQMFHLWPKQLFRTDTCPNTELSFGIPMNLLSLQPIPIRFNACNSLRQLTLSHNPSHTHARTVPGEDHWTISLLTH